MLSPGTLLGPYELQDRLGAGGMGEVYRARDPRLGREVAVKVLPPWFADDPERLHRFEQEARSAGQLNHPNILAVYDVGRHEGAPYLVSELLEGETLRQRLGRERLPLRRVLDFALQMARGLAAAHERGIVHRDLKPENLFITRDGHVKILDFGLAKLVPAAAAAAPSDLTLSFQTDPGMVLGTTAYMSPEQARGRAADHRSDVFSFGVVLYEMLSGRPAFQRDTPADTVSAVLREHPAPLAAANPHVERLIAHCLEKDPAERFQSMRDVIYDLEGVSAASSSTARFVRPAAANRPRLLAAAGAMAIVAVLLLWAAFTAGQRLAPARAGEARPVTIQRLTDFVGIEESPAISPDGRSVALSAGLGVPHIWVRLLAGGPPLQITRDDSPHLFPRWSSDGSSIIYFSPSPEAGSEGAIYEIPALGGPPRRLVASISGGDISRDGKRLAFFRQGSGQAELATTARDGSNPRLLLQLPEDHAYCCVRWSPDGKWIAYQRGMVFNFDVFAVPAEGGEPRRITHDAKILNGFAWLPDSSGIVYSSSRANTLLYLPTVDLWLRALDGREPRQLTFGESSYVQPDVDAEGRVLAARVNSHFDIWRFPIAGRPVENVRNALRITHQTAHVQTPAISPDESQLVYLSDSGGHSNLWVMKLDGSRELRQITFETQPDVSVGVPVWSPDGRHVTFFSRRPDTLNGDQWIVDPAGGALRRLVQEGGWASWSADGQWLYFAPLTRAGSALRRVMKVPVAGGEPVAVRAEGTERPAPAPDGKTLYFVRSLAAVGGGEDLEIHVASPEDGPSRVLASIPAWRMPQWQRMQPVLSPDGNWLALLLTDGNVTNIYALRTSDGSLRQITDFGEEPTVIARRVSWSPDSRHIYAAVGRTDADVVLLTNLLQ